MKIIQTRSAVVFILTFIAFSYIQATVIAHAFDKEEVSAIEEYLIDFSKKIRGHYITTGEMPSNEKTFFDIINKYYPDSTLTDKVRKYPVKVHRSEQDGYVLILCDMKSAEILYKDLGSTIDKVDFVNWREGIHATCPK